MLTSNMFNAERLDETGGEHAEGLVGGASHCSKAFIHGGSRQRGAPLALHPLPYSAWPYLVKQGKK